MMGTEAVVVALKAEMPHMVETRVVRKLQRAKGGMTKETSTRGSIPTILSQQVAEVGGMAAGHTRRMISLLVADLGTLVGSQAVALNREAMVQQIRVAMVQTVHRQELAVAAILAMLQKMVLSGLPFRRRLPNGHLQMQPKSAARFRRHWLEAITIRTRPWRIW